MFVAYFGFSSTGCNSFDIRIPWTVKTVSSTIALWSTLMCIKCHESGLSVFLMVMLSYNVPLSCLTSTCKLDVLYCILLFIPWTGMLDACTSLELWSLFHSALACSLQMIISMMVLLKVFQSYVLQLCCNSCWAHWVIWLSLVFSGAQLLKPLIYPRCHCVPTCVCLNWWQHLLACCVLIISAVHCNLQYTNLSLHFGIHWLVHLCVLHFPSYLCVCGLISLWC